MAHTAKDQVLCEELSVSGLKKIVEIAKKNILIILLILYQFKQEQLRQTELNIKASKKKQTTFEGQMNTIRDQKVFNIFMILSWMDYSTVIRKCLFKVFY